ncbi:MAG: aminoglycoside phosphotransferase family protein [Gemmatimonadota bacterium]|nr:aminoglycoside phosphotransferase family protein [Gemmatimonadota bacterium]
MEDISVEILKKAAAANLDLSPADLSLRRCHTGKYNTTWFLEGAPQPLVLRVAPPDKREENLFYEYRMMHKEPGVHRALCEKTGAPVPEIVAYDFSRESLPRDFLLMQRMPGTPLSDHHSLEPQDINETFFAVGRALKAVHAIHAESYGYLEAGSYRPMQPQSGWTSAFVIMWNRLLDDIEGCGGYTSQETVSMRRLLDGHITAFTRREPASLLHMDVWAQNILAGTSGQLTGLLDWDRALWGDPEIEFSVLDYCGISQPSFWEGYGRMRETGAEAEIRRTFYLLYEHQKYIFIRRVRGKNTALADQYRQQCLEMASALEKAG